MKKSIRGLIAACAAMACMGSAGAAVPATISYQGYLTDALGEPRNGTFEITFKLYNTAGTELWSETHPSVQVTRGELSVVLGGVTPLNLPFSVPYLLGVQVDTDPEMVPRQALHASPYARRAAAADSLHPAATIDGDQVAAGTVAAARLPPNIAYLLGDGRLPLANIPSGIDAATFRGNVPDDFAPAIGSIAYIGNRGPDGIEQFAGFNVGGPARVGGELQVGTVSGIVRLGNTGFGCSPSMAGSLRWTGTAFEGCNGSAWIAFMANRSASSTGVSTAETRDTANSMTPLNGVSLAVSVRPNASLLLEYSGGLGNIDPSPVPPGEPARQENICKFALGLFTPDGTLVQSTSTHQFGPTGQSTTFAVNVLGTIGPMAGGEFTVRPLFGSLFNGDMGICRLEGGLGYRLFASEL